MAEDSNDPPKPLQEKDAPEERGPEQRDEAKKDEVKEDEAKDGGNPLAPPINIGAGS